MIQDIDEEIYHAVLSSFADDTRLMKELSSQDDVQLLQNDLNSVVRDQLHATQWTQIRTHAIYTGKTKCRNRIQFIILIPKIKLKQKAKSKTLESL